MDQTFRNIACTQCKLLQSLLEPSGFIILATWDMPHVILFVSTTCGVTFQSGCLFQCLYDNIHGNPSRFLYRTLFPACMVTSDIAQLQFERFSKLTQNLLSVKLKDQQFTKLFVNASLPDRETQRDQDEG